MAFSFDDEHGTPRTVKRGAVLRGHDEAVLRSPWCFVPAETPFGDEPKMRPASAEPEPRFTEPVRVRAKCPVLFGAALYERGHEFVVPPNTAEWLISENYAEEA
jgi:hypothetical protein